MEACSQVPKGDSILKDTVLRAGGQTAPLCARDGGKPRGFCSTSVDTGRMRNQEQPNHFVVTSESAEKALLDWEATITFFFSIISHLRLALVDSFLSSTFVAGLQPPQMHFAPSGFPNILKRAMINRLQDTELVCSPNSTSV